MEILSWNFAVFTALTLLVYYLLPLKAQNIWLLLVSYAFYLFWSPLFAIVLILSTLFNYAVSHKLLRSQQPSRIWLWVGIGGNLLALSVFRLGDSGYADRLASLLLRSTETLPLVNLDILLPVGFSFYTLGAISYLVDVYRKQIPASQHLLDFALYMAYFPKMVSGPIERARTFLSLLAKSRTLDNDGLARAVSLIMIGLLRKILIAGTLSRVLPADLFSNALQYSPASLGAFLLIYAFWLYNDFAGYTSIVRGVSALFGIPLSRNFQQPYFARSFNEFWNRWHITLSHWLRDYIYFPLSRRLRRNQSQALNILVPPMVTMLVSGLWHNFGVYMLFWGGLHGIYQVLDRVLTRWKPSWMNIQQQPVWRNLLHALIVFVLTCLAWVAFGSGSFTRALRFWAALFTSQGTDVISPSHLIGAALVILLCLTLDILQYRRQDELIFLRWRRLYQAALLAFVLLWFTLNYLLGAVVVTPFVYQGF